MIDNNIADLRPAAAGPTAWYREPQFWLLLVLAVAIYLPRLTTLTIRGEESRRAIIAREMLETGDWIVPRTQGVFRMSRPPLQNWMIAGIAAISGDLDSWAVRLPGVFSTIFTIGLIYWYARSRLQPYAALLAGLAYASMFQVLEQGRTGETEPIFTATIAASLLLWHGGRDRAWQPAAYWSAGAAFAALALLTKGLQAPIYFFASTWTYLLVTGNWRSLLSAGHAIGLLTFVAVLGLWQVPFTILMGWENTWMIYFWNVAHRFADKRTSTFIMHLLTYPPSIIAGCLAPWSLLLLAYTNRELRQHIGPRRDMLVFLLASILICFPSVWLPPESRPRYFMPLFPCFAVLIGLTAEIIGEVKNAGAYRLWTLFIRGGAVAMLLAAAGCATWALTGSGERTPPLMPTLAYSVLTASLGIAVWRMGIELTPQAMSRTGLAMTAFLALTYVVPMITYQQQKSEHLPEMVADLHTRLPDEARLYSFDHVHHVFLHYVGETVTLLPWPKAAADVPAEVEYFCVQMTGQQQPELPFAWEEVAALSVDRNHHATPHERVIVGRRLSRSQLAAVPADTAAH